MEWLIVIAMILAAPLGYLILALSWRIELAFAWAGLCLAAAVFTAGVLI